VLKSLNRLAALENLYTEVDINITSVTTGENIKIAAKESMFL
jgi:hypothetical protein